ncbi:hypothetical protein [Nocardia fusca]|uniref:hypothetical protein n=1 Tax=Nocardia fusca TaxID=941183 RepID=UPI000AE41AF9|nr:hypothetical protein [Nocardia fusca]
MARDPNVSTAGSAAQVREVVAVSATADADPAWLLRRPESNRAVAFTFVVPDGSTVDLAFDGPT